MAAAAVTSTPLVLSTPGGVAVEPPGSYGDNHLRSRSSTRCMAWAQLVAAVSSGATRRRASSFVAAGTIAERTADSFCCVTTRRCSHNPARGEKRNSTPLPPDGGLAGPARRPRAAAGPPADFAASAVVWRPATAEFPPTVWGHRSNVGSTAAAGKCHRTLCADRPAAPVVGCWWMTFQREV